MLLVDRVERLVDWYGFDSYGFDWSTASIGHDIQRSRYPTITVFNTHGFQYSRCRGYRA